MISSLYYALTQIRIYLKMYLLLLCFIGISCGQNIKIEQSNIHINSDLRKIPLVWSGKIKHLSQSILQLVLDGRKSKLHANINAGTKAINLMEKSTEQWTHRLNESLTRLLLYGMSGNQEIIKTMCKRAIASKFQNLTNVNILTLFEELKNSSDLSKEHYHLENVENYMKDWIHGDIQSLTKLIQTKLKSSLEGQLESENKVNTLENEIKIAKASTSECQS